MRIKKTSNTRAIAGKVVNVKSDSTTDAYSCDYSNKRNTYSTDEVFTGKYWIDGKKIYRKVVHYVMPENPGEYPTVSTGLSNIENAIITIERQYGTNNSQYISAITGYNGYLIKSNGTFTFNRSTTDATKAEPGAYNIIIEYTKAND